MTHAGVVHAHLFWSVRRNRIASVLLVLAGLVVLVGLQFLMRAAVVEEVLDARPDDVAALAVRNLTPVYAVMTLLGLHLVGSDRRTGTLGWRVAVTGDPGPVHRGAWLLGAVVAGVVAVLCTLIAHTSPAVLWGQATGVEVEHGVVRAVLLLVALLSFFAWGVLVASWTSESWALVALGFLVPWLLLPVVRASLSMAAPGAWTVLRPVLPFEAALSLSSWTGHANPLTGEAAGLPVAQVVSCAALVLAGWLTSRHRLLHGRIDA